MRERLLRLVERGDAPGLVGELTRALGNAHDFGLCASAVAVLADGAPARAAAAAAAGVLPVLLAGMRTHAADEFTIRECCHALLVLTCHKPNTPLAIAEGVLPVLLDALRTHVDADSLPMLAMLTLRNMCLLPAAAVTAVAAGALPVLVAALRKPGVDSPAQEAGLLAINNMINTVLANAVAAGDAGAAEAAVTALQARGATDLLVARAACRVLGPLCQEPCNVARAVAAGALPALVGALRVHAQAHADVAELGSLALRQLTQSKANDAAAVAAGAVEALCDAMTAHSKQEALQEHACCALRHVVRERKPLPAAAAAAAIRGLVAALHSSTLSSSEGWGDVAYEAATALLFIVCMPTQDAAAGVAGAMGALVGALRTHVAHASAATAIATALQNATTAGENGTRAGAAGALAALTAAMKAHAADAALQEHACAVIAGVAAAPQSPPPSPAASAAALRCVMAALRTHAAAAGVAECGCAALYMLTLADAAAARQAIDAGAFDVIVAALTSHRAAARVQRSGCVAIGALLGHMRPEHATRGADAGAIEAVIAALAANTRGDATLEQGGYRALAGLLLTVPARVCARATAGGFGRLDASRLMSEEAKQLHAVIAQQLQDAETALAEGAPADEATAAAMAAGVAECVAGCVCMDCQQARYAGDRCGLLSCGAQRRDRRDDGSGLTLLRDCSRCKRAAYCCVAHQTAAWADHKASCVAGAARLAGQPLPTAL
jgi:hypothetical protein